MTEQAQKFADESGITLSATFVPFSQSRNKEEKHPSLNWLVTLTKGPHAFTVDYMQGCAHIPHYSHAFSRLVVYDNAVREACETGKSMLRSGKKNAYDSCAGNWPAKRVSPPSLIDVLHSLVLDSEAIDSPTYEEWAANYGYDTDSRKGEAVYRACLETALKLRRMLDLDAAREAFQGY